MLNRITNVLGFNVPQLVNFDDELRILEMTIVERPFVLDFAPLTLTSGPNFPTKSGRLGKQKNANNSRRAGQRSRKSWSHSKPWGIYLLDVSPANIAFAWLTVRFSLVPIASL